MKVRGRWVSDFGFAKAMTVRQEKKARQSASVCVGAVGNCRRELEVRLGGNKGEGRKRRGGMGQRDRKETAVQAQSRMKLKPSGIRRWANKEDQDEEKSWRIHTGGEERSWRERGMVTTGGMNERTNDVEGS